MRDALALELHQEVKLTTGEKVKKLRLVARTLVNNAIDGDTTAVRECFDRIDGKVTQSADATQVRGDGLLTPGAVAKMAVQSIAGRFQVNVTSMPLDAFAAGYTPVWLRRVCSRTGQRWARTGPMVGATLTRYDALSSA